MKCWIITIDALDGILADTLANKEVSFSCKSAEQVQQGDLLLGYIAAPINQIRMMLTATQNGSADKLFLEKQLDVAPGCTVDEAIYQKALAAVSTDNKCFEISEAEYNTLAKALADEVVSQMHVVLDQENILLVNNDGFVTDLTVEQLVEKLNEMYASAPANGQSNAVRMFGFKYAESITACDVSPQKIVDQSNIESDQYGTEIKKAMNIYYSIKKNEYGVSFANVSANDPESFDYSSTAGNGINKIFFGTPGCGKSYHIEHDILGKTKNTGEYKGLYEQKNIIRTTFYQDYSNTDFVGQILPKVVKGKDGERDTVEYVFNPGPFTLALIQAISNPRKKVALVIEEINRGNAPAIFGDVFQLLDRDTNSISEYGIVNVSLMDYLNDYEFTVDGQKKRYKFKEIKIPGNMDIFATMNTSDQNVYTLDTAFVRRWEKEKIKNTFAQCTFAPTEVPGMPGYTWETFVNGINGWIAKHLEDLQVNEDKQIGAFFVKESLLTGKKGDVVIEADSQKLAEKFAFKVFDYIWNDVAKLDRGIFFNKFNTLEDLIDAYKAEGAGVFQPGVFK